MQMFWTFKLNFDEDIQAFFDLATVLATFSKIWATFSPQSSGHPDLNHEQTLANKTKPGPSFQLQTCSHDYDLHNNKTA